MALTESEINTILADYQAARTAILKGGQSYTINSGGTIRVVTMADLQTIEKEISKYLQMLEELSGNKGYQINAGW